MHGPVDRIAAAAFLEERYGSAASNPAELGAGDWSRAFSFRLHDRDLVVRFGRHLEDFVRDREAMAFAGPQLPVPRVLEVGEALGGFYAVSERHFGTFLEALDEPGWRRIMPPLLLGLDTLRRTMAPGRGVDWGNEDPPLSWREWLVESLEDRPGARVSGWRARLSEVPEFEALFAAGERALRERVQACPELRHVLHRDLLNRNVLVAPDGSRLEAVFDWGCSIAGDFLYEIAWLTFWAPWYPALHALNVRSVVEDHYRMIGLAVDDYDYRLAIYELQIGLEHLAYAAFTRRDADLRAVADRTRPVLRTLA